MPNNRMNPPDAPVYSVCVCNARGRRVRGLSGAFAPRSARR